VPTQRLPVLLGQLIEAAQATPEATTSAATINPATNSVRLFISHHIYPVGRGNKADEHPRPVSP
jgi:hypothetical protein